MSGINWSDFGKNIEPELKIFSSNKNIFPTRNWSGFGRNNQPELSNSNIFPTRNYRDWRQPYNNENKPDRFGQQNYNYRSEPVAFGQQNYRKTDSYNKEPVTFRFGQTNKMVKDFNDHNTVNNTAKFPDTIIKNSEEKSVEVPKETPKKITNALLKLDKVSNTINGFMEDFLCNSGISNNKEYLDLWKSSGNQEKLCLYIKQKKIKMKETIEERNAKKLEKNLKRETKLKDIHQKRMDKQQSKPKTAFYYFKEDETVKLKLEHPTWNRKEVHAELQKKWKAIKNTDEARPYREKTKSDEDAST
jgi:hypothetical protein